MPHIRIQEKAKSAMQSGKAHATQWILEFEPASAAELEPLMGWSASSDTARQVFLSFASKEQAIAFAQKNGFTWEIIEPVKQLIKPKSYLDKFRSTRSRL